MKRLAIIPARGGSKRIPNKNIKKFCGQPMLSYAIQAACAAGIFDTIHVSTDDQDIVHIAGSFGFSPEFMRPKALSGDHVSIMQCLKFVVEKFESLGKQFDTVAMLYATSPLIDPEDLKKACVQFEANKRNRALLAVTPYPSPIEHAFRMDDNLDLLPDNYEALATRTQDLAEAFYDAGMFAIYSSSKIKETVGAGSFFDFTGFKVPISRVTDIDWPEDWVHAENLKKALDL
tara:strand:- start:567 stop:1262 length:696 start_codon:yes stop_codon:yes gene_type:complete